MAKRKVVVTGAAGYVAGRMLPALRERYDLTLLDVRTTNREGQAVEGRHHSGPAGPEPRCLPRTLPRRRCCGSLRVREVRGA